MKVTVLRVAGVAAAAIAVAPASGAPALLRFLPRPAADAAPNAAPVAAAASVAAASAAAGVGGRCPAALDG
eukprot:2819920-Alexandrium_andersonii.AAC.1